MNKSLPFSLKYQPEKISDYIINKLDSLKILEFAKNYKTEKKNGIIIWGPTGVGKTNIAYSIAKELNYEILEMNSSDYRDKNSINSKIGIASKQQSLFGTGKIILIDDIDALSGMKDRGCVGELAKVMKESKFPIILTAIDPYDSKLSPLRKISKLVELKEPKKNEVYEFTKKICDLENINYDDKSLNYFISRYPTDIRAMLNDLQLFQNDKITKENVEKLFDRKQTISIPKALQVVFKSKDENLLKKAYDEIDCDVDELILWLEENLPHEYEDKTSLYSALDYLGTADLYRGRIRRRQHWRFLSYIYTFLSMGIGLSKIKKSDKFISYKPTTRILSIWMANRKYTKRDSISEKIALRTHISKKLAIKQFSLIKTIYQNNKKALENLSKELDLDKDEIDYIKK
jgi:replication factor C large subunit